MIPESLNRNHEYLRTGDKRIPVHNRVLLMGILNVTPDSFSDGGQYLDPKLAIDHAWAMVEEGADILDIGAESTRPGSDPLDEKEELRRLKPVLQELGHRIPVPISVDTTKASVAQMALDLGAEIINDISALRFDQRMGQVVAQSKAGLILMHMKGTPQTMQQHISYENVVGEVQEFLRDRLSVAKNSGIEPEQIVIDPGIGFGKNVSHNLLLLKHLASFQSLGRPVMVGVSNKSFIRRVLEKEDTGQIMGTATAVATAVLHGAQFIRVHDVGRMREVVTMAQALREAH